jgi:hypothetical protein
MEKLKGCKKFKMEKLFSILPLRGRMLVALGCITRRKWSEGTNRKLEENKSEIIFVLR